MKIFTAPQAEIGHTTLQASHEDWAQILATMPTIKDRRERQRLAATARAIQLAIDTDESPAPRVRMEADIARMIVDISRRS